MPDSPIESSLIESWLIEAVKQRVHEFCDQLRSLDMGSTLVPNLEWTVADLGQHVACLPSYWRDRHDEGATFTVPDDFAAFSDAARSHIDETDPKTLADLVDREYGTFLDQMQSSAPQRWLYGKQVTPTDMCGLVVQETVLHGGDLAALTGIGIPKFTRAEANVAADAASKIAPAFIDPGKASAQPDGVYHVRFRGGNEYTWTKRGPDLTIELGRPARADAHLIADPATFLLSSLGRISQISAGLSGKMITYGRRPWRFFGLGNMAADGV